MPEYIAPDPVSQMPHVPTDLGSNLTAGFVKSLDDYINGLIHRVGDMVGAGVSKLAEGAVSLGNAVSNVASSAVAPFKPDFSPSASPGGPESHSPSHGLGRQREVQVATMEANLGNLSPPSTPSVGIQQGQGIAV